MAAAAVAAGSGSAGRYTVGTLGAMAMLLLLLLLLPGSHERVLQRGSDMRHLRVVREQCRMVQPAGQSLPLLTDRWWWWWRWWQISQVGLLR